MKIEIEPTLKLPRKTADKLTQIIAVLPAEHLRGLARLRLSPRVAAPKTGAKQPDTPNLRNLPGLYHPRQAAQPAWLEIAVETILPSDAKWSKRLTARLSFYNNLAFLIYSLVGQHYYLTLKHSVKRQHIETNVRRYTEQYARLWHEQQQGFRARLFKPFQPRLEKWAKSLQKHKALAAKREG